MTVSRIRGKFLQVGATLIGLSLVVSLATIGRAAPPIATLLSTAFSPTAEMVAPRDAWRLAENYAAAIPGSEVLLGSGDSMLPLYRDRTVLVVQRMGMSELRSGMTVVFTGDQGRPVAHTLLEKTPRGWRAMGVGNREPDRTLVRFGNLIGVVVKAYTPEARSSSVTVAATISPRAGTSAPGTLPVVSPAYAALAANE
ncbi:MAG: hypothetical protein EXS32_06455 [Opitutus sp.]|nr:hypothetical protein [Opitutus sp.]